MADELATNYSCLRITNDESSIVSFDDEPDLQEDDNLNLSLVGKVLNVRSYNFEAMKRTLNQIWSISKGALFRPIENDLFVVQFANLRDKNKVLVGRPWTFDQSLVILNEIDGKAQPSNISLTHCPFWVRLYNLPMDSRTERRIKLIGGGLGTVVEVDHDGIAWDKSARLKILLDVTKPLRRIQQIRRREGHVVFIDVKYERLPNFCYGCGILGHIERDCLDITDEEREQEKQWGSWLRASPRRGRIKMEEEVKIFRSCARNLKFSPPNSRTVVESVKDLPKEPQTFLVEEVSMPIGGENKDDTAWPDNGKSNLEASHAISEKEFDVDQGAATVLLQQAKVDKIPSTVGGSDVGIAVQSGISVPPIPGELKSFSFVAGDGSITTRFKKLKSKKHVVKPFDNSLILNPCNISNGFMSGDKRKLVDNMLIDDVPEQAELSVKKQKLNGNSVTGSGNDIVEAEVGSYQPRQEL
ncbi:uncharacterized protein LOC109133730 [Beta vulgaris subsp. vulgaris]|uniref:uncharacterized protein LOC109133730 n=1 Tax=Beta vulgaris subsp. vulgaris TaxID=3555 RepID=UPI000901E3C3|nr:uncharacterized protein LOC109133730 [Beta vulgaris subsp. vulgaris]